VRTNPEAFDEAECFLTDNLGSFHAFALASFSANATVKGTCKDAQGNPIAGAQVTWHNNDNGRTSI